MCGRYTQARTWSELVALYNIAESLTPSNYPPRYNIAPTQNVPAIRRCNGSGERELVLLRWGLIPSWARTSEIGAKMINARAETVDEKPSFRSAFKKRRCLIVADGFYEWQTQRGGPKQPFFISVADDRPFAFAGLWEAWDCRGGHLVESCTVITTKANDLLRPIHDRMPVILDPDTFDLWLDPDLPLETAKAVLRPYGGEMEVRPVGRRVNDVRNDDPGCMETAGLL